MRAFAAERLLPGEGDHIELRPIEPLRETQLTSRRRSSDPVGFEAIQSPFGTRTPDVVPFQVNTTSFEKSTLPRSGSSP